MGANTLFPSLFRAKARANEDLYAAVAALGAPGREEALHAALRVLDHVHVVDRIFRSHLTGAAHGHAATNTPETPGLAELRAAVAQTDRWYVEYSAGIGPAGMEQTVDFVFTDGKHGRMSRAEMLAHVLTHGAYHRGAVGRILDQQALPRPTDGLASYLHAAEPQRRVPA